MFGEKAGFILGRVIGEQAALFFPRSYTFSHLLWLVAWAGGVGVCFCGLWLVVWDLLGLFGIVALYINIKEKPWG